MATTYQIYCSVSASVGNSSRVWAVGMVNLTEVSFTSSLI